MFGLSKKEKIELEVKKLTSILTSLQMVPSYMNQLSSSTREQALDFYKKLNLSINNIESTNWNLFTTETLTKAGFKIRQGFTIERQRSDLSFLLNKVVAINTDIKDISNLLESIIRIQGIEDTNIEINQRYTNLFIEIKQGVQEIISLLGNALNGNNAVLIGLIIPRQSSFRTSRWKKWAAIGALAGVTAGGVVNAVQRHFIGPKAIETKAPTKDFSIGGKNYSLKLRTIYVAADRKSALTLLLGPSGSEEQLANLNKDLYSKIMRTGHLSVLYINKNGNLMVSEQLGTTKLYDISKSGVGKASSWQAAGVDLYEARGVNSNNVVAAAEAYSKNPAKFGFGQTCTSHVETLLDAGGLNLASKYIAIPMKGVLAGNKREEQTLMMYINTFAPSLTKNIRLIIAKMKGKSESRLTLTDFSEYTVPTINGYAGFHNILIKVYNAFPYIGGMDLIIPHTPPGLVMTGLTSGYLYSVQHSTNSDTQFTIAQN